LEAPVRRSVSRSQRLLVTAATNRWTGLSSQTQITQ
jgi:hypothetical protein